MYHWMWFLCKGDGPTLAAWHPIQEVWELWWVRDEGLCCQAGNWFVTELCFY